MAKPVPSLLLKCGCSVRFDDDGTAPICPTHGNQPVVRVLHMPKPRFTGAVSGPVATTSEVPAFTGRLVEKES